MAAHEPRYAAIPTIGPEQVEAEARALLQERIGRTPWFTHEMTPEQRLDAIEREVDRWWYLMIEDAARRLIECYVP